MSDKGERGSGSGDADDWHHKLCKFFPPKGKVKKSISEKREIQSQDAQRVEKPQKVERNCLVSISTFNNFFLQNLCYVKFFFQIHTLTWRNTDTFYSFMCIFFFQFLIMNSEYGSLRDTAATLGLGNSIEIKLARIERNKTGAHCYTINTDSE